MSTDRMRGRKGSAIVFAMLLLVLLNAVGMYAMSISGAPADGSRAYLQAAVARNMARAGAHAAIARLTDVIPDSSPYAGSLPAGPGIAGSYSVTSRRIGGAHAPKGGVPLFEDYALESEGAASGSPGAKFRVRAEVRLANVPAGGGTGRPPAIHARILKWEESGS